jgi:hypothetical protein
MEQSQWSTGKQGDETNRAGVTAEYRHGDLFSDM